MTLSTYAYMVEGEFLHNFNVYLNNKDRVSDGLFVSIIKPTDKYRQKDSTTSFYIVHSNAHKVIAGFF
jgi:hypothetical protein